MLCSGTGPAGRTATTSPALTLALSRHRTRTTRPRRCRRILTTLTGWPISFAAFTRIEAGRMPARASGVLLCGLRAPKTANAASAMTMTAEVRRATTLPRFADVWPADAAVACQNDTAGGPASARAKTCVDAGDTAVGVAGGSGTLTDSAGMRTARAESPSWARMAAARRAMPAVASGSAADSCAQSSATNWVSDAGIWSPSASRSPVDVQPVRQRCASTPSACRSPLLPSARWGLHR